MAITKTWGFGTDAAADTTVTPSSIPAVSGFGVVEDEPTSCALENSSSSLDVRERLTYQCSKVKEVASDLDNVYPPAVKTGVQYVVRLDEQLALTDSGNASYKEVLPVTAYVVIRHPINGNIISTDIDTIFKRLIGACYKEVSGVVSTRFKDLMMSALKPQSDGIDPAS
jgi:hypothetical protein